MTDFDAALERLLTDDGFKAALAADPARALAGYRLTPDEAELLSAQVSTDAGTRPTQVEQRISKASLFGLVSAVEHMADHVVDVAAGKVGALGAVHDADHDGLSDLDERRLGTDPHRADTDGDGVRDRDEILRHTDPRGADPAVHARGGLHATGTGHDLSPGVLGTSVGDHLGPDGPGGPVTADDPLSPGTPDPTYRTHVDVDGDGRWDHYSAYRTANGGVMITADQNGDGTVDFVGYDADGDGRVDAARYDENLDGRLDATYVDVDGDGWLDRRADGPTPATLREFEESGGHG